MHIKIVFHVLRGWKKIKSAIFREQQFSFSHEAQGAYVSI